MSRIILRNKVPCDAKLHVWVEPADGSDSSFSALARLVNDQSRLIWDNISLADASAESSAKTTVLRCPRNYVLGIKVNFFTGDNNATIFHKIVKPDGKIYGKKHSHTVPAGANQDGRQTIAIKMVQT